MKDEKSLKIGPEGGLPLKVQRSIARISAWQIVGMFSALTTGAAAAVAQVASVVWIVIGTALCLFGISWVAARSLTSVYLVRIRGLLELGQVCEALEMVESLRKQGCDTELGAELVAVFSASEDRKLPRAALLPRGLSIDWPWRLAVPVVFALSISGMRPVWIVLASVCSLYFAAMLGGKATETAIDRHIAELRASGQGKLVQRLAEAAMERFGWDPIERQYVKGWAGSMISRFFRR